MVYDGDGTRVAKTSGGVTTEYLVDDLNPMGLPQVAEEVVGGAVARRYTYSINRISQTQAGVTSLYDYDAHGAVRALMSTAPVAPGNFATPTDTYDYDAFGNLIGSTGTTPNVYRYQGEALDEEMGLYYFRARYYDPVAGRFLTVDPLASEGEHPYEYAAADPVNGHDPTGEQDVLEYTSLLWLFYAYVPPIPDRLSCIGGIAFSEPGATALLGNVGACQVAGSGQSGSNPPDSPKEPSCCDQAKKTPLNIPQLPMQRRKRELVPNANAGIFDAAFANAYSRLTTNESCCKYFGPDAVGTFQQAQYSFQKLAMPRLLPDGSLDWVGAATFSGGSGAIFINSQGPFINPSHLLYFRNGTPSFMNVTGGMSDDDFRAMILLHELGHLTGMFKVDTGEFAWRNQIYTNAVKAHCFQ